MRKPQHAWWSEIDNSYHPFVPLIKSKPHGISPIPQEIIVAQKREISKNIAYGDHKIQDETVFLSNPYKEEIENFI